MPDFSARSEQGGPPAKARLADVFALVCDSDVSDAELRLWLHYRQHHIGDRGAFISDAATTTALGWSARKLQDVRASLVRHTLLVVVPRGPRPPARYPCRHPQASQSDVRQASQEDVTHASQSGVTQASQSGVTQQELGSHVESHVESHSAACPIEEPRKPVNRNKIKAADAADALFERFIKAYPKRAGNDPKKPARKAWDARIKQGVDPEVMIAAAERYSRFCDATDKTRTEFVKQSQTWLSPNGEGWLSSWDLPRGLPSTAPAFPDYPKALVP